MREILFRGKRSGIIDHENDGEWTEGSYIEINGQSLIMTDDHRILKVDPSTVGQYTGKTDKYNAIIFEDDIIRANYDGSVGVIRFGEAVGVCPGNACHVGFYIDWQGEDKDYLRADLGYWASRSDVEVIGNIHDNPELLEDKP